MRKMALLILLIICTAALTKASLQDSVLIKHSCKVIEHGYFTFCTYNDNGTINKRTFGYSINLKKQTYAIALIEEDTLFKDAIKKNELDGYYESEKWNEKRIGTVVEKYFLLFDRDFLIWDNTQKLDFFMQSSDSTNNWMTSLTSSKYDLVLSEQISTDHNISINKSEKLFFKPDSSLFNTYFYYSDGDSLQKIDSIEYTPYKSLIHAFKNCDDSYVLIWETQNEQYSTSQAYLLKENQLSKIGELEVVSDCNSCEFYEFQIKELEIQQKSNKVEFHFSSDVRYKIAKPEERVIKGKRFSYVYDVQAKNLDAIEF
jgi:hypothetical protein